MVVKTPNPFSSYKFDLITPNLIKNFGPLD